MAAKLFLLPFPTAFTTNGLAEPGAKLEFYATGTSTPLPSYTTSALTTEHPWPVVANGAGRFESVYLDSTLTYRLVIKDSAGDTLDEIDPYIPGTLIGQQGSPGGNVMSIGLFTEASGIEVDEGTDIVQTSGYQEVGKGHAIYFYDEDVDAAYVTANPLTSFLADDLRGFRLSLHQAITPFHFGAVGDEILTSGVTDDSAALNAFFAFCSTRRVPSAEIRGEFGVSSGIYCDANFFDGGFTGDRKYTVNFECNFRIRALSDMDNILHLKSWGAVCFSGKMHFLGGLDGGAGGEPWTARKAYVGLFLENCGHSVIADMKATNLKYAGLVTEDPPSNTNMLDCGHLQAARTGSCPNGSNALGMTANITARSDTGSANSFEQRSVLTVDYLPPTYFDEEPTNYKTINVRMAGDDQLYTVQAISRGTPNTISVSPWLPLGVSSGAIDYITGAAAVSRGNDSNLHRFGTISGQNCGGGYDANCLYGGDIGVLHCEGRGVALRIGNRSQSTTVVGLHVGRLYAEGTRAAVMLQGATSGGVIIESFQPLDYSALKDGAAVRDLSDVLTNSKGYVGVSIGGNDGVQWSARGRSSGPSVILNFNLAGADGARWSADTIAFTLTQLDNDVRRVFLNEGGMIWVHGTGTNGAPTSVTFNPPAGGDTINGGASAVFTSFLGVTAFSIKKVAGATNWTVVQLGPRITYGTAAPVSGARLRGDWVINSEPSAAGVPGWVCVTAGSPGTWKAMGVLAS